MWKGSRERGRPIARPPSSELILRARQLDGLLCGRGTPFAFMGGLAVNAWSIPEPTFDIDLCADLPEPGVPALIRDLEKAGFAPPATAWLDSVGRAKFREFSVHWPFRDGLIPADFFVALDEFQRDALGRRRSVELDDGFKTEILAPEDLLVYKLIAWRPKDRAAIERLLAVQTALDWARVGKWAQAYQVEDRLREIRK